MTEVVSFENFRPPARFDSVAWEEAQINEAEAFDGPTWTIIDTITLSPLDADPAEPAERSFTTPNGTDLDLWYTVTFLDGSGGESTPTTPVQNAVEDSPYATTDDLFRILKKQNPSDDAIEAAQGDLDTATLEINREIDWADDHAPATSDELDLLRNVCVNRAADLWRHRESAPGILGIVDESMPQTPGRYSWARYAAMLSPLKDQWGVA